MIDYIKNDFGANLAIILKREYNKNGVSFLTPNSYSQQLGYMNYKSGHVIHPHIHNNIPRSIQYTNEVLFIKSGIVRVDFYSQEKKYLESRYLNTGDVVLLIEGGHGFQIIEDAEIIEVKQGPYAGDKDKTRFSSVDVANIIIKK